MTARVLKPEEYYIENEPYYEPIGKEIEVFDAAYRQTLSYVEPLPLNTPSGHAQITGKQKRRQKPPFS